MLFLHGWGMALEVWDRQVTALAGEFRTIAVDLRGHGCSPKPAHGYGYDDHVADLAALVGRLELDDVAVVGWSMGGAVAARLARRVEAVTQLVLVGTPPRFLAGPGCDYGAPADAATQFRDGIAQAREQTMRQVARETCYQEVGEAVHDWLFSLLLRTPTWAAAGAFDGVLAADVREDLLELELPILVLHGARDPYVSIDAARWIAASARQVRLVEFPDSGHAPFLEEPDRFNAELMRFLRRLPAGQPARPQRPASH